MLDQGHVVGAAPVFTFLNAAKQNNEFLKVRPIDVKDAVAFFIGIKFYTLVYFSRHSKTISFRWVVWKGTVIAAFQK